MAALSKRLIQFAFQPKAQFCAKSVKLLPIPQRMAYLLIWAGRGENWRGKA